MALPKRKVHLVVEEMGEEILVYCGEAKKAFCLNPVCARVFSLCDGTRDSARLAADLAMDETAVANSLAILQEHDLLEPSEAVKRRNFLKGAAALIPVVLAVAAPEPSMAVSKVAGGCITNTGCANLGTFVTTCRPCDFSNSTPANCTSPTAFCMSVWHVVTTNSGDPNAPPVPGNTCVNDTWVGTPGFTLNGCENTNANNIWAQDCNAARAAVIAAKLPGQFISNYKCCSCPGR